MVTLVFKKHFTKGNLAGLTITDHLPFVSNQRAWEWVANVLKNEKLDWRLVKNSDNESAWMIFDGMTPLQAAIDTFEQWYEAWK